MPDGKDILKTLIELYEAQEQIKVEYVIKERSTNDRAIPTPDRGA